MLKRRKPNLAQRRRLHVSYNRRRIKQHRIRTMKRHRRHHAFHVFYSQEQYTVTDQTPA